MFRDNGQSLEHTPFEEKNDQGWPKKNPKIEIRENHFFEAFSGPDPSQTVFDC